MNRLLQHRYLMTILFLISLISLGLPYKKVKCFVLVPPEQILPGVKQIAILDFQGDDNFGKSFADYLISDLLLEKRGIHAVESGFLGLGERKEGISMQEGTFTNVFGIVERSRLSQVINEQKLGATGLVDENQAVQIGKLLGVQAIVMGNVSYTYKDNDFKEKRTYRENKQTYTVYVDCRKRTVTAKIRARIIGTENGQILGSTESSREYEIKKCGDDIGNIPSVSEMVDACLQVLGGDIANYLTPHYVLNEYELEKIKVKQYKKIADKAAKKAENLEIDDAYILYKTIYDKDPYNPKLLYNMGILNEVVGNFEKAQEFYEMALQLKEKEKKYKKALKRVKKSVAFNQALKQLGIEIEVHTFEVSEADKAAALAQKIEIKGGSDDRVNVYAKPEAGSEIVTKVPGGITFTVIKQEGQWYRIKLLGGKEGYVNSKNAKLKK